MVTARCTLCWLGHCEDCDNPECECGHEWARPEPDNCRCVWERIDGDDCCTDDDCRCEHHEGEK